MIAEIGLNHNGDIDLARRMADAACESGANAAKFQLFSPEYFFAENIFLPDGTTLRDYFSKFTLKEGEWILLSDHVHSLGLDFFCSVFDSYSLDFYINNLNPSLIKTASGDINNRSLIEKAGRTGLPYILSTGTADENEVENALQWIPGRNSVILMHCVSSYPARTSDCNLRVLDVWQKKYSLPVAFSDHTLSMTASIVAVGLGAVAVEKHFTIDKKMNGPDQKLSSDPAEFRELVTLCREAYEGLGDGIKKCNESEIPVREGGRRSLYASADINAGEPFTDKNIIPLRPGGGSGAEKFYDFCGRKAAGNYKKGDRLENACIEG